jgi:hypothetical protein
MPIADADLPSSDAASAVALNANGLFRSHVLTAGKALIEVLLGDSKLGGDCLPFGSVHIGHRRNHSVSLETLKRNALLFF